MPQWEYLVLDTFVGFDLDRTGRDGWELVAVLSYTRYVREDPEEHRCFYFKRPMRSVENRGTAG